MWISKEEISLSQSSTEYKYSQYEVLSSGRREASDARGSAKSTKWKNIKSSAHMYIHTYVHMYEYEYEYLP